MSKFKNIVIGGLCSMMLCLSGVEANAENEDTMTNVTNTFEADPIFIGDTITIEEEPVIEFEGTVTETNKTCEFAYTAPRDGRYFIDSIETKTNCRVSFKMVDSLGNEVTTRANQQISLEEDETYTLSVSYYDVNTDFKITLRQQKPSTDITEIGVISDQLMFDNQKNVYFYTAPVGGTYQFKFTSATANVKFWFLIWDQYDSQIVNNSASQGSSTNIDFESGVTYQIQVRQNSGIGKYDLSIFPQKARVDISGYTDITDTIEFKQQWNYYKLTAPVSGTYTFQLKEWEDFSYGIWDEKSNLLAQDAGLWSDNSSSGKSSIDLQKGESIFLAVGQHGLDTKFGAYHFTMSYPAEAEEYLIEVNRKSDEGLNEIETDKEGGEINTEIKELQDRNEQLESELSELQEKYNLLLQIISDSGVEVVGE